MIHKKISTVVVILTVLSVTLAHASKRQSMLEGAQSQKEATMKLLDQEANLLNDALGELRENHLTSQVPPQIPPTSILDSGVQNLVPVFQTALLDLFK